MVRIFRSVGQNSSDTVVKIGRNKHLGCLRENDERDNEITADIRMRLGECFLEGIGTERDVVEALFNLNLAISIFYKYRDNKYIPEDIARCKELIEKAEAILDGKPDVSFKS